MISEPPKVELVKLLEEVRSEARYRVHPAVGLFSPIVGNVQRVWGMTDGKPSLSNQEEAKLLEEAVKIALGDEPAQSLRWETTGGNYHGITFDEQQARLLKRSLLEKMRPYVSDRIECL